MRRDTMSISGSLGNLSIFDEVERVGPRRKYKQLLRTDGNQVAKFTWNTYSKRDPNYPGYDTELFLRSPSVRLTYLDALLAELAQFLTEFQQMHLLFETARAAAVSSATQIQETAGKFHFDLHIDTPVIEFPTPSLQSQNGLVAYLGEISASNRYLLEKQNQEVAITDLEVVSIKLVSVFDDIHHVPTERDMMQDVNLHFEVRTSTLGMKKGVGITQNFAQGYISNIYINMSEDQYAFIMDLISSISKFPNAIESSNVSTESSTIPISSSSSSRVPSSKLLQTDEPARGKSQSIPSSGDNENNDDEQSHVMTSSHSESLPTFDLEFTIPSIVVEIFKGKSSAQISSLCKFSIDAISLKYCSLNTGVSEAEFVVHSFKITDTREGEFGPYREILPSRGDIGEQLVIHLSTSSTGFQTYTVTLDSPRIIVVPEHIFAIKDYFVNPQSTLDGEIIRTPKTSNESQKISDKDSQQMLILNSIMESESSVNANLSYRVNFVDVEIVILQNSKSADTEAIILGAKQLVVAKENVITVAVESLGSFLCRMDKRKETTLRFIQNFDFGISLDSRTTSPGHLLSNIDVDIGPVTVRVSYRDVLLILDIVNQMSMLSSPANSIESQQSSSTFTSLTPSSPIVTTTSRSDSAFIMARERVMLEVPRNLFLYFKFFFLKL